MGMKRRSFLQSIAGAIAAVTVNKVKAEVPEVAPVPPKVSNCGTKCTSITGVCLSAADKSCLSTQRRFKAAQQGKYIDRRNHRSKKRLI